MVFITEELSKSLIMRMLVGFQKLNIMSASGCPIFNDDVSVHFSLSLGSFLSCYSETFIHLLFPSALIYDFVFQSWSSYPGSYLIVSQTDNNSSCFKLQFITIFHHWQIKEVISPSFNKQQLN